MHPDDLRRNGGAKPGDALILTKALGIGVYSAALKKGELPAAAYGEMIASTTLLNRIGPELAKDAAVHAMTDVTGFGLLGHGLEMARASEATLAIRLAEVPFLSRAAIYAREGHVTGASGRNWASYGEGADLPAGLPDWQRHLLTDPQTSGGLLVACAASRAEVMLRSIQTAGYPSARRIGEVRAGPPRVTVLL
jgi:selenide,water dikinase